MSASMMMSREEIVRALMQQGWDRHKAERAADLELSKRGAPLVIRPATWHPQFPITRIENAEGQKVDLRLGDGAALVKQHRPRQMNKTEQIRDRQLRELVGTGEVLWYAYEGITLKLANDLRYTPDFAVVWREGKALSFEEVKGPLWNADARAKIKMAAKLFPHWVFQSYQRTEKLTQFTRWVIEEYCTDHEGA